MRNKGRTAVLAVLLAAVMCMMSMLSGCTGGFFGARVDTEGTDPYQTPNVRGVWNAGSINNKVQPYFDDVIASLKLANSNDANELVGKMRYAVENIDGQNVLTSWIEGTLGQRVMLPNIVLNAGKCEVADYIPECISDYETLKYAMIVASYGINVDLYNMDTTVSMGQMAGVLISWYEGKTGKTVDTANVSAAVSDDASKKLLALIPDYEYDNELIGNGDATTTIFVDTLASLMTEVNFEVYGVGSGSAKLMDLVRYAEPFLRMYVPEGVNYEYADSFTDNGELGDVAEDTTDETGESEEDVKLSTQWAELVSSISLYNTVDSVLVQSEQTITRLDLAKNMLLILKAGYDTDVQTEIAISDCSEESAEIMVDYGIMPNFPEGSNLFNPDYEVRAEEIPELIANLTKHCYTSWNNMGSYHYYDYLTMNNICKAFAELESFYSNYNYYTSEEAPEVVINNEPNNWFMSVSESGEYEEKNTVVAVAAMALRWSGKMEYTTESLRNAYLSETDAEWDNERVVSALEDNGVAAAECEDITTDAILSELRAGNIIAARYNSTGTDEVQMMVIYGFEKVGNSVRYYVNDPNIKHNEPAYADGSIPGVGETLESELALWLINEENGDYIVVYAAGNDPASGDVSATDE